MSFGADQLFLYTSQHRRKRFRLSTIRICDLTKKEDENNFAAFEKSELKRSNVDFWYGMKESLFVEETWREGSWGRTKEDSMAWKKTGREKKSKDKHKIGFRWRGKIPSCNRVRE